MRVIGNAYVDDWERRPDELRPFPEQMLTAMQDGVMNFVSGAEPDPDRTCMPCGQGAGGILEIASCAQIVEKVMNDARETIAQLTRLASDR